MKHLNKTLKLIRTGATLIFAAIAMVVSISTVLMVTAGDTPAITTYYSVINDVAGTIVFAGMGWVVAKKKREFKAIWKSLRAPQTVAAAA